MPTTAEMESQLRTWKVSYADGKQEQNLDRSHGSSPPHYLDDPGNQSPEVRLVAKVLGLGTEPAQASP